MIDDELQKRLITIEQRFADAYKRLDELGELSVPNTDQLNCLSLNNKPCRVRRETKREAFCVKFAVRARRASITDHAC